MLCGCLRNQETPTPLDAPMDRAASSGVVTHESNPNKQILTFALRGGTGPNFDFIPIENGNNYIAKYRVIINGEVVGRDSKPISKAVFDKIRVIRKRKSGNIYCIDVKTGEDLFPYFRRIDEETARRLGVTLQ